MTTEAPILFSAPMVREVLAGRKTQTRRVIRWSDRAHDEDGAKLLRHRDGSLWPYNCWGGNENQVKCRYSADRLWVQETWAGDDICGVVYRADHPSADIRRGDLDDGEQTLRCWKPSIFMSRWASRIDLTDIEVGVERLQDISTTDIFAEGLRVLDAQVVGGVRVHRPSALRRAFVELWDSLNAKRGCGWDKNPWVWVVKFKRLTP